VGFVRGCIFVMQSPESEVPVSVASCDKRRVSVASKPQRSNVDSLCDIGGSNQSEQFLPRQKQSEWLSRWNTTYALSSVLGTRATTTARLTFRFRIISVNPCLVTCDDAIHEVLIRFCLLKEISGDRRAVLDCEGFAESRRIFRSSVKMAWHVRRNFTHCLSPIYAY